MIAGEPAFAPGHDHDTTSLSVISVDNEWTLAQSIIGSNLQVKERSRECKWPGYDLPSKHTTCQQRGWARQNCMCSSVAMVTTIAVPNSLTILQHWNTSTSWRVSFLNHLCWPEYAHIRKERSVQLLANPVTFKQSSTNWLPIQATLSRQRRTACCRGRFWINL